MGQRGVVSTTLEPKGQVRVQGEIWKARSEGETLLKEERIEVISVEGLTLVVRRETGPDAGGQAEPAMEKQ